MANARRALMRKELREDRWKLILGIGIFGGLAVLTVLTHDLMTQLFESAPPPPGFLKNLGVQVFAMRDFKYYIWSQWFAKNLQQAGIILAILTGMGLVASEVSQGTADFLVTKPLSRKDIIGTKIAAGAVVVTVVALVSTLLIWPVSLLAGKEVSLALMTEGSLVAIAGLLVVFGIAVLSSTLFSDPIKAGALALAATVILSVPGWFPRWREWSFLYHMQGESLFVKGVFPWGSFAGLILLALGVFVISARIFERKEF